MIGARATHHVIARIPIGCVIGRVDPVVAVASEQGVLAVIPFDAVIAFTAKHYVVLRAATVHFVAVAAVQLLMALLPANPVVAPAAGHGVLVLPATDSAEAIAAEQGVMPVPAGEAIDAVAAEHLV